jgi:hypothetical protein
LLSVDLEAPPPGRAGIRAAEAALKTREGLDKGRTAEYVSYLKVTTKSHILLGKLCLVFQLVGTKEANGLQRKLD